MSEAVPYHHVPVLLREVIEFFNPLTGQNYIDCTVGGAGHAVSILERTAPDGILLGIDIDPRAVSASKETLRAFGRRARLVNESYVNLKEIARREGISKVHGILLDLGASAPQFGDETLGFSFQKSGPLIMTFSGRKDALTAEEVVNTFRRDQLAEIIRSYGEERCAFEIANKIIARRNKRPIRTTGELADIVIDALPHWRKRGSRIHPATKTFQALRIYVNSELENLTQAIPNAINMLVPGGRLCIISFHSLEDRIVKHAFKKSAKACICPSSAPVCACLHQRTLKIITKRVVTPTSVELKLNPRARSARLRVGEKI